MVVSATRETVAHMLGECGFPVSLSGQNGVLVLSNSEMLASHMPYIEAMCDAAVRIQDARE